MAATDFDYIATRNEIIEGALRIVGVLEKHQSASGAMLTQAVNALQLLVKHWGNKGLKLWNVKQSSFVTVSAQEAYTTADLTGDDDTIIGLDKAWVVDSNDDLELEVVSYSRYLDFYDKETNTGRPQAIAFRRTPSPSFYIWPSPDAVYTVKTLAVYPLKDLSNADDSGDIPAEFQRALKYGLAEDLFDEYPGPMNERQFVQKKAAELFFEAKAFSSPMQTTSEVEGLFPVRRCK